MRKRTLVVALGLAVVLLGGFAYPPADQQARAHEIAELEVI